MRGLHAFVPADLVWGDHEHEYPTVTAWPTHKDLPVGVDAGRPGLQGLTPLGLRSRTGIPVMNLSAHMQGYKGAKCARIPLKSNSASSIAVSYRD